MNKLLLVLFAAVFAEELDVDAEAMAAADMSDTEYEEMFNELDENSDGKLTLTEVMDSLQSELEEEFGDEVPEKLKKEELLSFVEKTQEYLESLELAGGDDDEDMDMPDDERRCKPFCAFQSVL